MPGFYLKTVFVIFPIVRIEAFNFKFTIIQKHFTSIGKCSQGEKRKYEKNELVISTFHLFSSRSILSIQN